jgi:hypothetical protein
LALVQVFIFRVFFCIFCTFHFSWLLSSRAALREPLTPGFFHFYVIDGKFALALLAAFSFFSLAAHFSPLSSLTFLRATLFSQALLALARRHSWRTF